MPFEAVSGERAPVTPDKPAPAAPAELNAVLPVAAALAEPEAVLLSLAAPEEALPALEEALPALEEALPVPEEVLPALEGAQIEQPEAEAEKQAPPVEANMALAVVPEAAALVEHGKPGLAG